jgi:hypothetical protein
MLRGPGRSEEWSEYVANTLIRRGFSDPALCSQVESAARRTSPMGLVNLAALLIVVPDMLASVAASVVAVMSEGKSQYVEENVAPFVYAAADTDPELLVRLVEETVAQDDEAGRRFGEMVARYLRKPFVQRRFAQDVATEMAKRVRRVGTPG